MSVTPLGDCLNEITLHQVLQVNLNTVWTLARDCGRHMLASRGGIAGEAPVPQSTVDSRPRGKIINVASLVSFQGKLHTVVIEKIRSDSISRRYYGSRVCSFQARRHGTGMSYNRFV
jgi:NAD(P)-dependent dehydrogenase (short-subunit alcohol dehydrogenase family)